jgi:hypothetical protein
MTLKEKFESSDAFISGQKRVLRQMEIAEDFAIGFAEWVEYSCWKVESDRYLYEDDQLTTKELLQIYKKEKGL